MSRIKVDRITDKAGTGAPTLVNGMNVTGKSTMGDVVGAAVTFNSITGGLTGDVTGNVTGSVTGSGANLINLPAGQLTGALPAISGANLTGIEGPSVQMVIDGALSAGESAIITSAGKAKKVTSTTGQLGARLSVNGQKEEYVSCCQVSATQYVIAYCDVADHNLKARVATITDVGNSVITYGAAVTFNTASSDGRLSVCYDSNVNRVFIAFSDRSQSNRGYFIVGTISGTGGSATITFGSKGGYEVGATSNAPKVCFDATNNKVLIVADVSSSQLSWVCTVASTGNSATTGTQVSIDGNSIQGKPFYHPGTGKIIVQYKDQGAGGYLKYKIGTISGTTISYGSDATVNASAIPNYDTCVLNSTQFLTVYRDEGDSGKGKSRIGTISGTSITFGSINTFNTTFVSGLICTVNYINPTNVRIYFSLNSPSNAARVVNGTTSGTDGSASTSWGSASAISGWGHIQASNQGYEFVRATTYSGLPRTFMMYNDGEGSGNTYCVVDTFSNTDLTASNFLGFSKAAYTDGQTGTIKITGNTLTGQSGLTPGETYYVQNNGTLGGTADDPSISGGKALTSTSLLIK